MNSSVNTAHPQWFKTAYQNKTFHDQRIVYNMDVVTRVICEDTMQLTRDHM